MSHMSDRDIDELNDIPPCDEGDERLAHPGMTARDIEDYYTDWSREDGRNKD